MVQKKKKDIKAYTFATLKCVVHVDGNTTTGNNRNLQFSVERLLVVFALTNEVGDSTPPPSG